MSPEEVQKLVAAFEDPSGLQAGGIYLCGEKHMFIRSDDRFIAGKRVRCQFFSLGPPEIRGLTTRPSLSLTSQDKQGIFAWKAATCVVIGTHGENIQGNNCNTCVGNLADYLLNSGM